MDQFSQRWEEGGGGDGNPPPVQCQTRPTGRTSPPAGYLRLRPRLHPVGEGGPQASGSNCSLSQGLPSSAVLAAAPAGPRQPIRRPPLRNRSFYCGGGAALAKIGVRSYPPVWGGQHPLCPPTLSYVMARGALRPSACGFPALQYPTGSAARPPARPGPGQHSVPARKGGLPGEGCRMPEASSSSIAPRSETRGGPTGCFYGARAGAPRLRSRPSRHLGSSPQPS
ncbi:hypothetical protein NDU88_000298 [Pleurodeles waltl]|uniref:Uncharacterized protein n=1 Tax=Pleurodeles waltl TaxID=8319 RepID=A0AAV7TGS4_PLEWA|nr:hypothetical protein NDU88_000298 [Pleurodeles waltl]